MLFDIEWKIDKIASKTSSSTCGISYEVLMKTKEYVKRPRQHMTKLSKELGYYPDPSNHGIIKPLYKEGKEKG